MKRLFLMAFLLTVCFILPVFVQNAAKQNTVVAVENYTFENIAVLSCASGNFHHDARNEGGQPSLNRLLPTFQKSPFIDLLINEEAKFFRKSREIAYIFYAECFISRFDGVDIIHPFDYFW